MPVTEKGLSEHLKKKYNIYKKVDFSQLTTLEREIYWKSFRELFKDEPDYPKNDGQKG